MRYLLIIEKGDQALWGYFPDVPGCTTAGSSVEEIRANAQEALAGFFEDGDPVPEARPLEAIVASGELALEGTETLTWVDYEQAVHQLATA